MLPIPPTSNTHPPLIVRKTKPTNRSNNSANYKTQNMLTNVAGVMMVTVK